MSQGGTEGFGALPPPPPPPRWGLGEAAAAFVAGTILSALLGGLIQAKKGGQVISCKVRRGNRTITLHATLEERPSSA